MTDLERLKLDNQFLMRELKVLRNGCGWATAQDNFKDTKNCILIAWERSAQIRAQREAAGLPFETETGIKEEWE